MARPRGTRNAEFDAKREDLLQQIHRRIVAADGPTLSLNEMAVAAGVSVPTLRHYFSDRSGVLRALLEREHRNGQPYLLEVSAAPLPPLRESVRGFLDYLVTGLRSGVLRIFGVGFVNGLQDPMVAKACLSELLEPIVQALEVRLARHQASGDMRAGDVRHAALALIAPVVLAVQHQDELEGRSYRPLDLAAFLDDLADSFARAHRAS